MEKEAKPTAKSGRRHIAAAIGSLLVLAGCDSHMYDHNNDFVAPRCDPQAAFSRLLKYMRLVNTMPAALTVPLGTVIVVKSEFQHQEMTFATPHPKSDVCEISQTRLHDGSTEVNFGAIHPGTVYLFSTEQDIYGAVAVMAGQLINNR